MLGSLECEVRSTPNLPLLPSRHGVLRSPDRRLLISAAPSSHAVNQMWVDAEQATKKLQSPPCGTSTFSQFSSTSLLSYEMQFPEVRKHLRLHLLMAVPSRDQKYTGEDTDIVLDFTPTGLEAARSVVCKSRCHIRKPRT